MTMKVPDTLNGYPVISSQVHKNCATVAVARDPHNSPCNKDVVIATWWPSLGDNWMWGHYSLTGETLTEKFHEVSARNIKR